MILILNLLLSQAFALQMNFFMNGQVGHLASPQPYQPGLLEFSFEHKGEKVLDFKPIMGHDMHVVIIKKDLSSFAHFHGSLHKMSGLFHSTIHLPTKHPDNFESLRALPSPGTYMVLGEVHSNTLGLHTRGANLKVQGEETLVPLVESPRASDGRWFEDHEGGLYRTNMKMRQIPGCRGTLVEFDVELLRREADGSWVVPQMDPWLMMGAHGILLSQEGENFEDKAFYHTHSEALDEKDKLHLFSLFHSGEMKEGLHKFWIQIKTDGQVRTFPIVFYYRPVAFEDC